MYGGALADGTLTDELFVFDLNTSEAVTFDHIQTQLVMIWLFRNTSLLPPSPYFPCPISGVPIP